MPKSPCGGLFPVCLRQCANNCFVSYIWFYKVKSKPKAICSKRGLRIMFWLKKKTAIFYSFCQLKNVSVCAKSFHCVQLIAAQLFVTLWTVTHQAPFSMGFSRQEYWSRLPCPPPRNLPDPRIEPVSPVPPPLADGFFTTSATWEAPQKCISLVLKGPF